MNEYEEFKKLVSTNHYESFDDEKDIKTIIANKLGELKSEQRIVSSDDSRKDCETYKKIRDTLKAVLVYFKGTEANACDMFRDFRRLFSEGIKVKTIGFDDGYENGLSIQAISSLKKFELVEEYKCLLDVKVRTTEYGYWFLQKYEDEFKQRGDNNVCPNYEAIKNILEEKKVLKHFISKENQLFNGIPKAINDIQKGKFERDVVPCLEIQRLVDTVLVNGRLKIKLTELGKNFMQQYSLGEKSKSE